MHPTPNSDPPRKPETNAGRDRHRDHHNSPPPRSFSGSGTSNAVVPPENPSQNVGGSLRDRISDKGSTALSPSYSGRPERDVIVTVESGRYQVSVLGNLCASR